MRTAVRGLGVVVAVVWLTGCTPGGGAAASFERGAREAREAAAAGKLTVKEYPPPPSPAYYAEYIRLPRERCGVGYEVPRPPPGTPEADFVAEVRGWNSVTEAEVRGKFGADTFERLREEAGKRWRERGDK